MGQFIPGFPCLPASFNHPHFFGFFLILQTFVMSQPYINVDVKSTFNFYFCGLSTYLSNAFVGVENAFPALIQLSHVIQDPNFPVWRKAIRSISSYAYSSLLICLFYFKNKLDIKVAKCIRLSTNTYFFLLWVRVCPLEKECCDWVQNSIYQSFFRTTVRICSVKDTLQRHNLWKRM